MLPSVWRYKRFHISYVLAWTALGLLIGLVVSQWIHIGLHWLVWYVVAACALMGALRSRRWFACCVAVMAGIVIGFGRGSGYLEHLAELDAYVGQNVIVHGSISQDPTRKNGSDIWHVQLNQLQLADRDYVGEVYVTVHTEQALRRGDSITISGKAQPGFGSFRLSLYRAELQAQYREDNVFLDVRDTFATALRQSMPEPEASLGLGFVVGQKSALPDDLVEQLKIVGLTHIVVASGYNLTILVRFARRLLARKSRYLAFVGSVGLVIAFVMVSGLSPSMNRAAIVTGLSLLAWYYGRQFHPVQLIAYVAAASAFIYPVYIWSDLGWLLSFTAFIGVLVVAPILVRTIFPKHETPPATGQLVVETVAAELMTLPVIMVYFGYIPVFALLANILVAPVIPFAMAATFIAGLGALAIPAVSIIAIPASVVIAYVVAIVERLSSIAWAQMTFEAAPFVAIVWYGVLVGWMLLLWKTRRVDLRASSVVD